MAGAGKTRIADADNLARLARVTGGRLWVDAIITGGGGGGGDVNIAEIAGVAVAVSVPGALPVSIENEPIEVEQATHDDLNCNANLQVGNADVAFLNPVPVNVTNTSIAVTGTVSVSSITTGVVPGTGNLNLGKAEDSPHVSGTTGVMALAVRNDAGTALAGNGDYIPLTTDDSGLLRVTVCSQDGDPNKRMTQFLETDSFSNNVDAAPGLALVARSLPIAGGVAVDETIFASSDTQGYLLVRAKGDVVTTLPLSASTRGRPVQITATASTGTTIHTATTTSGQIDRIYIYLTNTSTSAVTVTIEFGTTGVGNEVDFIVPANDTILAIDGAVLGGAATDTVTAYATTGSVVNANGRVERLDA